MSEQRVEGRSVDFLKREKITTPFRFGAPCLVCKRNHNSSSAPGWSGLVAIVSALAPRELGGSSCVGRWNDGGLCAVLLCCCVMSVVVVVVVVVVVAVVLLFVYVCVSVLVCFVIEEAWCFVTRAGCLPPAPTLLC